MKNILDVEVSEFDNYSTPYNPKAVNLHNWLTSDTLRSEVEQVRAIEDKRARDVAKSKLPAITISGLFSRRCSSGLIQYSGLICIDIDGKDNTHIANFGTLKTQLCRIVNVAYCGKSISGAGYFVIIPLAYPDRHAQHFDALLKDFASIGITVDKSCRDVSRLRGASWDNEAHFNLSAKPYNKLIEQPKAKPIHYASTNVGSDVERLMELINRTGTNIAESYVDWFAIGCALASEFGNGGRSMFHSISSQSAKYNRVECDTQFSNCLRDKQGYTIKTFFSLCKDNHLTIK